MPWLVHVTRPLAALLVVLLLLSTSGAATLCVEADGTTRIELVSAVCCGASPETDASAEAPAVAPVPECAGCDDQPLADARWSRPGSRPVEELRSLALPPVIGPALLAGPRTCVLPSSGSSLVAPPSPRGARPSSLRC